MTDRKWCKSGNQWVCPASRRSIGGCLGDRPINHLKWQALLLSPCTCVNISKMLKS